MLDNVQKLFKTNVSTYRIAKDLGIPEQTIRDLRNGKTNLEDSRYKVIHALNNYYKERFEMKEFKTVNVNVDEIVETEIIESINANDDNVVGRNEGNQEVVISKVTFHNGTVFGVAYETDGVADGEEYFETLEEAKEYAERIN